MPIRVIINIEVPTNADPNGQIQAELLNPSSYEEKRIIDLIYKGDVPKKFVDCVATLTNGAIKITAGVAQTSSLIIPAAKVGTGIHRPRREY